MVGRCALLAGIAALFLATGAAHAQRYDSSYGYEQRGFYPPSPFPRASQETDHDHKE
jgi:hypothetical protein